MTEAAESTAEGWIEASLRAVIADQGSITLRQVSAAAKRIRRDLESAGSAREAREAAIPVLAKVLQPNTTEGKAETAAIWLLNELAAAGLTIVETASVPATGGARRRPNASHHPGSKERRTGSRRG